MGVKGWGLAVLGVPCERALLVENGLVGMMGEIGFDGPCLVQLLCGVEAVYATMERGSKKEDTDDDGEEALIDKIEAGQDADIPDDIEDERVEAHQQTPCDKELVGRGVS